MCFPVEDKALELEVSFTWVSGERTRGRRRAERTRGRRRLRRTLEGRPGAEAPSLSASL